MNQPYPIILFYYNRPWQVKQEFQELNFLLSCQLLTNAKFIWILRCSMLQIRKINKLKSDTWF